MPRSRVSYSYLNQADPNVLQRKEGNLMELELQNVPKFDAEEYMPPQDDFRPVVLFYYGGREMSSPDSFWDEWRQLITEYVDKFTGNSREIHDAAVQAIGDETDPEKSCASCMRAPSKSGIFHSSGNVQNGKIKKSISSAIQMRRKFCNGDMAHHGTSMQCLRH